MSETSTGHKSAPAGTPRNGEEVAVDVAGIEKELAALWRGEASNKALTRACSWNFIVYAGDDDVFAAARAEADKLVQSVPTRSILVKNQPRVTTGTPIEAWVSANCQIGANGGKLLCTEEIHIESRGTGAEHVPGLLRALVVADVPTALWWPGAPPTDATTARALLSGVDRLIVDSTAAEEGVLKKLAHVGGLVDNVTLVDLAWLKTASLRSLLASAFDPPVGSAPLWSIKRVQITATTTAPARLLIGWLSARLKWSFAERVARSQGASWRLQARDEQSIAVDIDLVEHSPRRSGIVRVVIETNDGNRYGFVAADGDRVQLLGPDGPGNVHTAVEPADDQLLVAALGSRGRDRLYATALHRAVELDR